MNINKLAKDIHANAVEHGWWDEPRSFGEIIALCHAELSEALEEDRAGHPLHWYAEDGKPEGVAVELIDCIIRVLDFLGSQKVDVEDLLLEKHAYNKNRPYKHGKRY